MDFKIFVESLSLSEMNQLSTEIHNRRKKYITENLKTYPPLDTDLIELCRKGDKIKAIIAYRERTNLSLVEAKTVVDVFCV